MSEHDVSDRVPAFIISPQEREILRHLQFEADEKGFAPLIRRLLRTHPDVQRIADKLHVDEPFHERAWGGNFTRKKAEG